MFKKILTAAAVAAVMCGSASAVAADFKIGLVSPARILAESAPAVAAHAAKAHPNQYLFIFMQP